MSDRTVRRRFERGESAYLPIRRYKLTAALSGGGSADAVFMAWSEADDDYVDTADDFTLYSGVSEASGNSGDQGFCSYFPDRGQWEVIGGGGGGGGNAIAVLTSALLYGTDVGASATLYRGQGGREGPAEGVTVFEWKLQPGDVVLTGFAIDVFQWEGRWYMGNSGCAPFYYFGR